jgi:hypothetical protein
MKVPRPRFTTVSPTDGADAAADDEDGETGRITDYDGAILLFPSTINMQSPAYTQAAARCDAWPRNSVAARTGRTASAAVVSAHVVDLVRVDGDDQTYLVAPAIPGVRGSEVPLGELLDVLGGAFGGNARDLAADREIPSGVTRV